MFDISESLAKLIEENSEKLQKFEEWISTQPHIPKNIPRVILIRYLKVCKFDLENAEKLLDKNVKFKINHQYLFADRNIESEEFQKAVKTVQYTILPKQTKAGYTVEFYRIFSPNSTDFILKDILRTNYMIHDMSIVIEPDTNGIVSIYDANGFTFSHFIRLLSQIQTLFHFLQYGQESVCVEMQQIHVINCSQIVSKLVSIMKPFLGKELRENMHFHSNGLGTLHKYVDKECLPVELGGFEGNLDDYMEDIIRKLHKHKDFLTRNENFFLINK